MSSILYFPLRKVTLTEIEEGVEWNWPDPGNLEESTAETVQEQEEGGLSADEIFDTLDGVIQVR
jgi:hypothetical protein